MEGHRRGDVVVVGGDARQRFHDARGYGRPLDGDGVALAPVEAAHLLARGDLDAVDGDGFPEYVASHAGDFGATFLVYADLRARGFYLSPAREGWVDSAAAADLVVFERGSGPPDGTVAHAVKAIGERADVPARDLGDQVLAVADEEGEVTYFETGRAPPEGSNTHEPTPAAGVRLADRVLVPDPPADLYARGFYGQPLGAEDGDGAAGAIQLSLVEAAFLARRDVLSVEGGASVLVGLGREVEGDRFDRRLAVYEALRGRGVVPKTGFKFGADFRTYPHVESVDDLGHSTSLVHVLPSGHVFSPRELALVVRLAGGVRKRTVFALTDADGGVDWLTVGRLTP